MLADSTILKFLMYKHNENYKKRNKPSLSGICS